MPQITTEDSKATMSPGNILSARFAKKTLNRGYCLHEAEMRYPLRMKNIHTPKPPSEILPTCGSVSPASANEWLYTTKLAAKKRIKS